MTEREDPHLQHRAGSGEDAVTGPAPALRPVARTPLHTVIAERLLSHIVQSELEPGDRLPSERELSARLGVSRTTVRHAIVQLRAEGLLDVRHGGGTFLRPLDPHAEAVAAVLDRRRRLPEVLEARRVLELPIAALAASRRTAEDLAAIDAGLERMRREIAEEEPGLEGDAEFHAAVTAAAHNPTLAELMEHLSGSITETRSESLAQPGRPPRSLEDHMAIAEAVHAGDPEAAEAAMRRHLDHVADLRLFDWQPPDELPGTHSGSSHRRDRT
ncbi:MAG: FadR/GntR family transcriptional regulator [Nitriliruptoraceae bacterium]